MLSVKNLAVLSREVSEPILTRYGKFNKKSPKISHFPSIFT